ncbi:MAG: amidohydrolase family protein, partial [Actinobacteria bacterium]|nr:amidohydrolase family protein [Actinomycetota bacterium]NIS35147.1 amidohydrolase family protein [Actinomycetota bacterium]NIU21605.1 amidohydrolase family protein [Actinomycetota bacterium]NIU69874.1 amidohydrolase family protein [Actinomycetota bacterium]NIV89674.1 amidohydrolase family protein [Actinomycetota bacterium]
DLVVSVHTGYTDLGSGRPGGGGVDLAYADPVRVDRVAADFPDLRLVLAHPGWPWQDELLAVAMHKPNVWLEFSGRSPSLLTP